MNSSMDARTANEFLLRERDRCLNLWVSPNNLVPKCVPSQPYTHDDVVNIVRSYVVNFYQTENIKIELEAYGDLSGGIREAISNALDGFYTFRIAFTHTFENVTQLNKYKLKHPESYQKLADKVRDDYMNGIYTEMLLEANGRLSKDE